MFTDRGELEGVATSGVRHDGKQFELAVERALGGGCVPMGAPPSTCGRHLPTLHGTAPMGSVSAIPFAPPATWSPGFAKRAATSTGIVPDPGSVVAPWIEEGLAAEKWSWTKVE